MCNGKLYIKNLCVILLRSVLCMQGFRVRRSSAAGRLLWHLRLQFTPVDCRGARLQSMTFQDIRAITVAFNVTIYTC